MPSASCSLAITSSTRRERDAREAVAGPGPPDCSEDQAQQAEQKQGGARHDRKPRGRNDPGFHVQSLQVGKRWRLGRGRKACGCALVSTSNPKASSSIWLALCSIRVPLALQPSQHQRHCRAGCVSMKTAGTQCPSM